MRKVGTLKLEDKTVEIKEFTVRDVMSLLEGVQGEEKEAESMTALINEKLPKFCNLTTDDLLDMTPSELDAVWEKFKEVNSSFFKIAGRLKLEQLLDELILAIHRDFFDRLSALQSPDMALESGS